MHTAVVEDRAARGTRLFALALVIAMVAISALAVPASAGGSSSTFSDPIGDTLEISGPGSTPAYLDIVGGAVTEGDGRFEFSMDLAAPVPGEPALAPGSAQYWWMWFLDTDPTTFPTGFPRVPGIGVAPEFALWVAWDGVRFTAFIVDRRPTLTGGEPELTPVGLSVDEAHVSALLDAEIIDDPASFAYRVSTRAYRGLPGTEGFVNPDGAPAGIPGTPSYFIPWPS